jgi:acyl carrier protein phosphodiesterase
MNYLVHLYLSTPGPLVRLGNLMGDFVKGRLELSGYAGPILRGLRQHRFVDSHAASSAAFQTSVDRLAPEFGRYRPIIVDIAYDHILARHWDCYSQQTLVEFTAETYQLLTDNDTLLPMAMRSVAKRMIAHDWLTSYRRQEVVATVLHRLGSRMRRPNPLAEAYDDLVANLDAMQDDCHTYLQQCRTAVEESGI